MTSYCTFPITDELYDKLQRLAEKMEQDSSNNQQYLPGIIEILLEQVDIGVDYFFWRIPNELKVSSFGLKIVNIGIKTMKGGMHMIVHKVLGKLNDEQIGILIKIDKEMLKRD
ncbi:hypothetical protein WDW89_04045 [Deltaproteobacteria bacterium TL4]